MKSIEKSAAIQKGISEETERINKEIEDIDTGKSLN